MFKWMLPWYFHYVTLSLKLIYLKMRAEISFKKKEKKKFIVWVLIRLVLIPNKCCCSAVHFRFMCWMHVWSYGNAAGWMKMY